MFLAYLWATVENQPLTSIPDQLRENPGLTEAFGLDPNQLSLKSAFRPVRLENRFEDLIRIVERTSESIETKPIVTNEAVLALVSRSGSQSRCLHVDGRRIRSAPRPSPRGASGVPSGRGQGWEPMAVVGHE